MKLQLQWGGFYTSKNENGKFGVFRLLDFNIDAYHIAIYSEEFDKVPTLADIQKLKPFIGHAPIDSKALLNRKELTLIGNKKLVKEDLIGYSYYLTDGEDTDDELKSFLSDVISFSHKPPMNLLLSLKNGKLDIKELKK